MRLTTLTKTETSLDSVVDRLYPNLSDQQRRRVTAGLLKVNPQLSEGQRLRPGLVIQVPTQPDHKTKAAGLTDDPVEDLRTSLNEAVSGYQDLLTERAKLAMADIARQEELLKQKDVATAIKSSKEATDLAKELAGALKTQKKSLEEDKKVRIELFARIDKDLKTLLG
jgi:hypothetical protein